MVCGEVAFKMLICREPFVAILAGEAFGALMYGLEVPGEAALLRKSMPTFLANKIPSLFMYGRDVPTKVRRL